MREPTVLSALTAALLRAAALAGVDLTTLREETGLTEDELADPDGRVSLQLHLRVLEVISALPRPIGLEVGGQLGAQGLGVVGYAMQHDATLGSALEWLERYRALVLDELVARTEQVTEEGRARLVFAHVVPPHLAKLREPAELWAEALKLDLPETSLASRVRRLIEEMLPNGEPTIDELGRKLALSGRTLQRRLKEERAGFAELLDDVRRERAMMLLEDARLTVAQISFLLGYSEPTAFFRAFRRWTGGTPQAWRVQDDPIRGRETP